MIPKIIHLCWFGKKDYPPMVNKCILSWKEKLPNYSIMIWNEDTFDINSTQWTKEAYSQKKWAFIVDYVRLLALSKYGGIYLDTDMEVLNDFSRFLIDDHFVCGFIEGNLISMGFLACEPNSPFLNELINYYQNARFLNPDGSLNNTMNTLLFTKICIENHGLKYGQKEFNHNGLHIYPCDFFMPYRKNILSKDSFKRKNYILTKNTIMIHHDLGSWDKSSGIGRIIRGVARLLTPSFIYLSFKKRKFKKELNELKL